MDLAGDVALLFEIEGLVDLAEAAFANERQEEVAFVERRVILEARVVLVVYALEFAYVQIALAFELLQLALQVDLLLLERGLPQSQDLVRFVPVLQSHPTHNDTTRVKTSMLDRKKLRKKWILFNH